jgi:hypothetical protein
MIDPAVTAACLAALAAIAAGVVAWLAQRDAARLRSELGARDDRLRNDLARDLAGHESALRVAGELKLRMLAQASESTAEAARVLAESLNGVLRFANDVSSGATADFERIYAIHSLLLQTGVFLPPELDKAYDAAAEAISLSIVTISALRSDEKEQRYAAVASLVGGPRDRVREFRDQASGWKKTAWARINETDERAATHGT